jgi:hypothetical protein
MVVVMVRADGPDGLTVTEAEADAVGTATLVAVTVTELVEVTDGAVYKPVAEIDPLLAFQVTLVFDVLLTKAVNC